MSQVRCHRCTFDNKPGSLQCTMCRAAIGMASATSASFVDLTTEPEPAESQPKPQLSPLPPQTDPAVSASSSSSSAQRKRKRTGVEEPQPASKRRGVGSGEPWAQYQHCKANPVLWAPARTRAY